MAAYGCRKTPKAPAMDGKISPEVWDLADPVSLVLADTGKAPVQPTEVRLLYDDAYLYVAFHCVDDEVWGTMLNRDDPVCAEEAVEIFFEPAPGGSGYHYYEIEVSPLGTVYDLCILNDTRCKPARRFLEQMDFEGLRTGIHIEGEVNSRTGNDTYWNCEIAIPFIEVNSALSIPPTPGDRWRMNLYRIDRRRTGDEFTSWQPIGIIDFHHPEKFGDLVFA